MNKKESVNMMSRVSRAKQFLPFDALAGFSEALREKECEYDNKKELTEESYEELEIQLNRLEKGSKVKIRYYKNKKYIEVIGIVTVIDYTKKKIQLNGEENISVYDIVEIEVK